MSTCPYCNRPNLALSQPVSRRDHVAFEEKPEVVARGFIRYTVRSPDGYPLEKMAYPCGRSDGAYHGTEDRSMDLIPVSDLEDRWKREAYISELHHVKGDSDE